MFKRIRRQSLWPLAWALLAAPVCANAQQAPTIQTASQDDWRHRCDVERELQGGAISLSRIFTEAGAFDGGDFMRWVPKGHDLQHPRRPLDLELSYIWDLRTQPQIEPRVMELTVRLSLDQDLPDVSTIEIKRPFPVQPHGVIGGTALSTPVFPYSGFDRRNGHGELPLGDLLAYSEGYDALDWSLVRPSDQLGGGQTLARGVIDIDALREAVNALPELRAALASKAADPITNCERVRWPNMVMRHR